MTAPAPLASTVPFTVTPEAMTAFLSARPRSGNDDSRVLAFTDPASDPNRPAAPSGPFGHERVSRVVSRGSGEHARLVVVEPDGPPWITTRERHNAYRSPLPVVPCVRVSGRVPHHMTADAARTLALALLAAADDADAATTGEDV